LTSRVVRFGHACISSVTLLQIAQPIVEELAHKTEKSIAFSVLEGAAGTRLRCQSIGKRSDCAMTTFRRGYE
jgi:DNA-binding IclR family transcriptional regulator